jgi:hypothetical protein
MPLTLPPDIVSRKALAAGFAGKTTRVSPAASAVPLRVGGVGRRALMVVSLNPFL